MLGWDGGVGVASAVDVNSELLIYLRVVCAYSAVNIGQCNVMLDSWRAPCSSSVQGVSCHFRH